MLLKPSVLLTEKSSNTYFYLFSILDYKENKTGSNMGNRFSLIILLKTLYIDGTCSIEEPQQKYCLGTASNRLLGLGMTDALPDLNPRT